MAARPHVNTPVDHIIMVLSALGMLCKRHKTAFSRVRGDDFDGEALARELKERLEEKEATYQTERREDVEWTNNKDEVVGRTAEMAVATKASVELGYHGDGDLDDRMADFKTPTPSKIRTLPTANNALRTMRAGLKHHASHLQKHVANYDEILAEVETLLQRVDELGNADAEEQAETRTAAHERDQAKEDALDFIDRLDLTARVASPWVGGILAELDAIFAEHVPQPNTDEPTPTPQPQPEPTEV
ncbi:hypothetical protein FIV42_10325 [Persicimonas caeni]|uniref:Uncharacterized protein n=1 Tax=Persicimonas caeni TaxID=2292766 RepID=A0A4Y6PTL7_PERCE|nr:hypothetical protein [Persicimonas caeni]QDG51115.1 hypothetical protein FIV42_10325 [Persicimonas caeni]QED32336.1 hypothetical protein FRD00_10320 [Persicimonas caeni]